MDGSTEGNKPNTQPGESEIDRKHSMYDEGRVLGVKS